MSQEEKTGLLSNIRGDIFGGLTAGIVALPLALAFGVQSGMGAAAGLFGAIFIGFFASLFGGTNTQISGPTAPMTAVSMLIIAGIVQSNNGNLEDAIPSILIVFLLAGLFQVLFGVIKIGSLIKYIPYPVVSGFMTGIGVIILITQLLPLLGYVPSADEINIEKFMPQSEEVLLEKILREEANEGLLVLQDFKETILKAEKIDSDQLRLEAKTLVKQDASGVLGALKYLPKAIQNINWLEFILSLITILIIYGFKRITKAIPSTLVALLVVSGAVAIAGISASKIGYIPEGFPKLRLDMITGFQFREVTPYIFTALSLAMLGAIDSLLTSIVADNMTKTRHKSNRELIGQGIGNSVAAFFGGIPGAGATIRTVVNIDAGGRTRLSGMIAAVLLLVVLLILGPFAAEIPKAVLAGILITVGFGVMDYKGLRALRAMPFTDAIVLLIVLSLTVFWDLIPAVGIGLVISTLMFMKQMSDVSLENSRLVEVEDGIPDDSNLKIPSKYKEKVFTKKLKGPLFFGNTRDIQTLASKIPSSASHVIIDMSDVPYMDKSGLLTLEDILLDMEQKDTIQLFIGLNQQTRYMMESFDIIPNLIPEEHMFDNFQDTIAYVREHVKV